MSSALAIAAPESALAPRSSRALDVHEFFAPQHTGHAQLPDPVPLLRNLTVGVLESIAGVRKIEQVARWVSQDTFLKLSTRVNLASRARSARDVPAARPTFQIMSLHHQSPADGVVEAVLIVETPLRTRAIAIRLEGLDRRWRATSIAIL